MRWLEEPHRAKDDLVVTVDLGVQVRQAHGMGVDPQCTEGLLEQGPIPPHERLGAPTTPIVGAAQDDRLAGKLLCGKNP